MDSAVETPSDEAFARYVLKTCMATEQQLQDARDSQAMMAEHGRTLALSDALVKLGVITPTQKANVEQLLQRETVSRKLGNYKLIKKLGEGTMGTVYLAEDTIARRKVALKVLPKKMADNPEFLTRFQREAQATGKLNHINLVTAFAVGEESGLHYYAMEFCEGESLDIRLKREKRLSYDVAVEILMQIARGLAHAHEQGIVHRDIKPANIMLLPDGTAKVLDMGLAKMRDTEQSYLTQSGLVVGTPHYMSPEQARGDKDVDGRADIYSLGTTLYHLVTGRPPFDGDSPSVVLAKQVESEMPNPQDLNPDISDSVVQIIARMTAKRPADRYKDCNELAEDFERILHGQPLAKPAPDPGHSGVAARKGSREDRPRDERARSTVRQPKLITRTREALAPKSKSQRQKIIAVLVVLLVLFAIWDIYLLTSGDSHAEVNAPSESTSEKPKQPDSPAKSAQTPAPPPSVKTTVTTPTPPSATQTNSKPPVVEIRPALQPLSRSKLFNTDWSKAFTFSGALNWKIPTGGKLQVKFPDLYCETHGVMKLEFPGKLPPEFDIRFDFVRKEEIGDINVIVSRNGQQFMYMMDGLSHTGWGFELVNGKRASGNSTTVKPWPKIEPGSRHVVLIRVTNEGLEAHLDGKLISVWSGDWKDLSLGDEWKIKAEEGVGLGCWNCNVVFYNPQILPQPKPNAQ